MYKIQTYIAYGKTPGYANQECSILLNLDAKSRLFLYDTHALSPFNIR